MGTTSVENICKINSPYIHLEIWKDNFSIKTKMLTYARILLLSTGLKQGLLPARVKQPLDTDLIAYLEYVFVTLVGENKFIMREPEREKHFIHTLALLAQESTSSLMGYGTTKKTIGKTTVSGSLSLPVFSRVIFTRYHRTVG